jgi:hypothetical protein
MGFRITRLPCWQLPPEAPGAGVLGLDISILPGVALIEHWAGMGRGPL